MSAEALDILKRARARLARPEAWTQRTSARNAAGEEVPPDWPSAVKFCPVGACMAEGTRSLADRRNPAWDAVQALNQEVPEPPYWSQLHPVAFWNNQPERDHAEVLALLDQVIAAREATP